MGLFLNEALVVLVRSLIAFFSLLILARLLGKQQISQLTFFEYVLGITIGSIAGTLSVDLDSRAWPHWVGLITWSACVLIMQWFTLKFPVAGKYLIGKPTILIMNGKIMEKEMNSIRYNTTDLMEQLRDKDVFDLNQVAFAVLENNGELSVLLKPEYRTVTCSDMYISPQPAGLSTEIIINGKIIEENLESLQKDRLWLEEQLTSQNISCPEDVFLATYNAAEDKLFIDKYKDH